MVYGALYSLAEAAADTGIGLIPARHETIGRRRDRDPRFPKPALIEGWPHARLFLYRADDLIAWWDHPDTVNPTRCHKAELRPAPARRRPAADPERHQHVEPDPAVLWRLWACAQCTPELYASVMREDPPGAPAAECPWCIATPRLHEGRYVRHSDDGEECRGSGLSRTAATRLLRAAVRRRVAA